MVRSGQFYSRFIRGSVVSGLLMTATLSFWPGSARAICGEGIFDGASNCYCDCNRDCAVTIDEAVYSVNLALGLESVDTCSAADLDGDSKTTVNEVIACVQAALNGCDCPSHNSQGECDDGGLCVGGANAGTVCISEDQCIGDGACFGGTQDLHGCVSDDDCDGAPCRKCRPYGGDGCSADCTVETAESCVLVPPPIFGPLQDSGSRLVMSNPLISAGVLFPPLPLTGSQVLTVGKQVDASSAVVIRASSVHVDPIEISQIVCVCIRSVEARTCGGTLFDVDGAQSINCTEGFPGAKACSPEKACAAVYGPGNSGSGFIGCGDPGVDVEVAQDCNATPGGPPFDPQVTVRRREGELPASRGSGFLGITTAISAVVGRCSGTIADYGPDGLFCTDDDPISGRGTPTSILLTTNAASAILIPNYIPFVPIEPITTFGAPFTCNGEGLPASLDSTNLAGAWTACDQLTSDFAATVNFVCE